MVGVEDVIDDVRQDGVAQDVDERRLQSQVPAFVAEGLRQVEAAALESSVSCHYDALIFISKF